MGLFYSCELPVLLGLSAPDERCAERSRTILTTVGAVTYTRAYTACAGADGKSVRRFPLDEALGITEGCTPAMASMVTWAGARFGSYDEAGEALARLAGVAVTGRRVQRMVNAVAENEAAWVAARSPSGEKGGIHNIQADMTGIRMRPEELRGVKGKDGDPKKCQIKVGAVFRQQTNADGEIQRVPDSTTRVGASSTIAFFSKLAKGHPKQAEIEAALHYFTSHRKRMKYREFRQKGYFIGSGVIEGNCKCLVNQRTDLGGQRWLKSGSLNVLRIRAAIADNLHDNYWKTQGKLRRKVS